MTCDRCKREVSGTIHTRENYTVDMYHLFTGKAVPMVFKEEGEEETRFLKIERPAIVAICKRCYRIPDVAEALQRFEPPPGC